MQPVPRTPFVPVLSCLFAWQRYWTFAITPFTDWEHSSNDLHISILSPSGGHKEMSLQNLPPFAGYYAFPNGSLECLFSFPFSGTRHTLVKKLWVEHCTTFVNSAGWSQHFTRWKTGPVYTPRKWKGHPYKSVRGFPQASPWKSASLAQPQPTWHTK